MNARDSNVEDLRRGGKLARFVLGNLVTRGDAAAVVSNQFFRKKKKTKKGSLREISVTLVHNADAVCRALDNPRVCNFQLVVSHLCVCETTTINIQTCMRGGVQENESESED